MVQRCQRHDIARDPPIAQVSQIDLRPILNQVDHKLILNWSWFDLNLIQFWSWLDLESISNQSQISLKFCWHCPQEHANGCALGTQPSSRPSASAHERANGRPLPMRTILGVLSASTPTDTPWARGQPPYQKKPSKVPYEMIDPVMADWKRGTWKELVGSVVCHNDSKLG